MTKNDLRKFEALEKRIADLEAKIEILEQSNISKRADGFIDPSVQEAMAGMSEELKGNMREMSAEFNKKVGALTEEVNGRMDTANANFNTLNTELPKMATKLSKTITKLSSDNSFYDVGDVSSSIGPLGSLKTM